MSGDPQTAQKVRFTPGLATTSHPLFGETVTAVSSNAANAATGAPVTRRQSMQGQQAMDHGRCVVPTVVAPQWHRPVMTVEVPVSVMAVFLLEAKAAAGLPQS